MTGRAVETRLRVDRGGAAIKLRLLVPACLVCPLPGLEGEPVSLFDRYLVRDLVAMRGRAAEVVSELQRRDGSAGDASIGVSTTTQVADAVDESSHGGAPARPKRRRRPPKAPIGTPEV